MLQHDLCKVILIFFSFKFVIGKISLVIFIYLIKEEDNHSLIFFLCKANVLSMHVTYYMLAVIFASVGGNFFLGGGGREIFRLPVIEQKL